MLHVVSGIWVYCCATTCYRVELCSSDLVDWRCGTIGFNATYHASGDWMRRHRSNLTQVNSDLDAIDIDHSYTLDTQNELGIEGSKR